MEKESQALLSYDVTCESFGSTESRPDTSESLKKNELPRKHPLAIAAILSTAFAYGCILTTLFVITLPVECQRIQRENPNMQKSVTLGIFVAVAGVTQLISPLIGMLSDTYLPPVKDLGQRLPYLVLGSALTVIGLLGQGISSSWSLWIKYGFAFFIHMIGLNIVYSVMIALIPDQVPKSQTGIANGLLAFLLVTGSLFGFSLFHGVLRESIQDMYGLYICIVIFSTIITCSFAHDGDVENTKRLNEERKHTPYSSRRPPILSPMLLLQTMLLDPFRAMDWSFLLKSYTIDTTKYHDFFIVTVSRTFYYMGISVQTFFLFYMHDIIGVRDNPEGAVATLAIVGQCAGALTCYPVGLASDLLCGGRRKPFVYLSCAILAGTMLSLTLCSTMKEAMIVGFILGGANGMYLTMDTSLAVDTLPSDVEIGESGHAQLLGIWGVAGFIGSALGPLIGGPLLYLVGSQDISQTAIDEGAEEYNLRGYAVILSLSALYFFLSAITLKFIRDSHV